MSKKINEKPFERTFRHKRLSAFLTTSAALFCVFCLLSSSSIRDFTTSTRLQIFSDLSDTHSRVRTAVSEQLSDAQLSAYVSAAASNADLVANADIATHNLALIRDALNIQLKTEDEGQRFVLTVDYRGKGTDCERHLTRQLAHALARQLDSRLIDGSKNAAMKDLIANLGTQLEAAAGSYYSELETASDQVSRINAELSNLFLAIRDLKLPSDNQRQNAVQNDSDDNGPMRVVNTSIQSGNMELAPILTSLEQVDTDTLQTDLTNLRERIRNNAIKIREKFVDLKMSSNGIPNGNLIVDSIAQTKTTPLQHGPGMRYLFLFGLLSSLVGACVAMSYKPSLDGIGYDSIEQAEQLVGLPMVATLNHEPTMRADKKLQTGFANSFVRVSEVILFAFLLLIILLCLVQPEIREAMFSNPFHGLSKISALFFG